MQNLDMILCVLLFTQHTSKPCIVPTQDKYNCQSEAPQFSLILAEMYT